MAEKKFTIENGVYSITATTTGGFSVRSIWDEPLQAAEAIAGAANAGATRNTRVGNKIQTQWLQFRMYMSYSGDAAFAPQVLVRITIFTWKHGTVPVTWAIDDIFEDVTTAAQAVNASYARDNIHVIKSWYLKIGGATATATNNIANPGARVYYSKSFKRNMVWFANTPELTTANSEPYLNITYCGFTGANAVSNAINVNFISKVSFTDL